MRYTAFLRRGFTLSPEVSSYLPDCNKTLLVQLSFLHFFPVSKMFNYLKAHSDAADFRYHTFSYYSISKIAPTELSLQSLLASQTLPLLQFRGSFTQSKTIIVSCSDRMAFYFLLSTKLAINKAKI